MMRHLILEMTMLQHAEHFVDQQIREPKFAKRFFPQEVRNMLHLWSFLVHIVLVSGNPRCSQR